MEECKSRLLVVGLVVSIEFQRSRFYAERLYKSNPKGFEKPDIRPLLNVSWSEYLTKIRRKVGGRVWTLRKHCVVFLNGYYLGDDEDLFKYSLGHARIRVGVDFHTLGLKQLEGQFHKKVKYGRKFAYFSVDIDGQSIGSLLFMLYAELVPLTTTLFLKRCESKNHGWRTTKIHRIVKGAWLQGGGFSLKNKNMPCENYIIPHDRRGVLSMCNGGKHTRNTVQYIISLNPAPWMDHKYVAFGQLMQGEEVLRRIEAVPTRYEAPKANISIPLCGEYKLGDIITPKEVETTSRYFANVDKETGLPRDIINIYEVDSNMSVTRYKQGNYCLSTDLKGNPDLMQLPSYLLKLYEEFAGIGYDRDLDIGGEENDLEIPHRLDSELIPIINKPEFQLYAKRELKDETEVDDAEVVTKITQLDEDVVRRSLVPSSSLQLQMDDAKTLYV